MSVRATFVERRCNRKGHSRALTRAHGWFLIGVPVALCVPALFCTSAVCADSLNALTAACGSTDSERAASKLEVVGQAGTPPLSTSCKAPLSQYDLPQYWSLFAHKRVMDNAGNLRGPIYSTIKTQPMTLRDYSVSPQRAFNADFSNVPLAIEMNILNDALGDPATLKPPLKYLWGRTAAAIYIRAFNTAGVNNSNSRGENRTGYGSIMIDFNNASRHADPDKIGGDMSPLVFNGFGSTARPHATSFLGNPAVTGVAGQLKAGANGVFMEPYGDLDCVDGGYDAACLSVINLQRDNATGNLNTNFVGSRIQSTGRKPIDAFVSAIGPGVTGVDLTAAGSGDHVMLQKPAVVTAGAGYMVGDKLTLLGGVCDQEPVVQVASVDERGGVGELDIDRRGMCSAFPKSPARAVGGHGSGTYLGVEEAPQIAIQMPRNSYIFGDSICDRKAFGRCFPSTTVPGASYFGYSSSLLAWNFVTNGAPSLRIARANVTVNPMLIMKGGITTVLREIVAGSTDKIDRNGFAVDHVVVWRTKAAGERTETFPGCATNNNGRLLIIKDGNGQAEAHPIVVKATSGTIEGADSFSISHNRAAVQFQCDGDALEWIKIN